MIASASNLNDVAILQADLSFLTRRLNSVWPTRTPHPSGYWDSLVDGSARRLGENHHRVAEDA
jgi:hypothetical protein